MEKIFPKYFTNAPKVTEHELIQGCIREDRNCQKILFHQYAGKMLTVCRRYARHEMEAEDLLQDAFIKVFLNIGKYTSKGSFEGWIRRIVINTALKNCQKHSFQKERIGLPEHDNQSVEPIADANLGEEELLQLIADLPDGYQVVFNLYVIDGYSHKEIGELLNIGDSTSRSQLVKARKLLQTRILSMQKILL